MHKNLSRFTGEKARPTGVRECGPDKKSYLMSGTVILPMLNNAARYQLEGICCRIFLENGLSGDRHNGGEGYFTEIFPPELFFGDCC